MTIGEKIRNARIFRNMTQAELGKLVGLSGDRIRQYENGVRNPKQPLLQSIADALHVNILALSEIDLSNEDSIMHALFELEATKHLRLEKDGKDYTLRFSAIDMQQQNPMFYALERWYEAKEVTKPIFDDDDADSFQKKKDLYQNWKFNYPNGRLVPTESDKRLLQYQKLMQLRQETAELEKELVEAEEIPSQSDDAKE